MMSALVQLSASDVASLLLHFLWQGTLVGIGLGLWLRWRQRRGARPAWRYRACLAGLLAASLMPVLTLSWPALQARIAQGPLAGPLAFVAGRQVERDAAYEADAAFDAGTVSPDDAATGPLVPPPGPTDDVDAGRWRFDPGWLKSIGARLAAAWTFLAAHRTELLPWLAGAWCLGTLAMLARIVVGWRTARRWVRSARPAPEELVETGRRIAQALRVRLVPRVLVSDAVREPCAWGFFRPVVLLPAKWLAKTPGEVWEAVVAHETAHVRRWDVWTNLAQRVIESLLFFHPAVWWMSRHARWERELCCDELAVSATGRPVEYARALEYVARKRVSGGHPLLVAGMRGAKMSVLQRVRQVLGLRSREGGWSWRTTGVVAACVPLSLAGWSLGGGTQAGTTGRVEAAVGTDEASRDALAVRRSELLREESRLQEVLVGHEVALLEDGDRAKPAAEGTDERRKQLEEVERQLEKIRDERRALEQREREILERAGRPGPERRFGPPPGPPRDGDRPRDVERPRDGGPEGRRPGPPEGGPRPDVRREGDGDRPRFDPPPRPEGGPPPRPPFGRDGQPPREGDRPRDGERPPVGREGERPREGAPGPDARRPGPPEGGPRRDGDRPLGPPGPREIGPGASNEELMRVIHEMRREIEQLRRELHQRGPGPDGPPREGFRPPGPPRDGAPGPEGRRPGPPEGAPRREGDRPPEGAPRRDGDRPQERREGTAARAEVRPID